MLDDGFYLLIDGEWKRFDAMMTRLTKYPQNPITPDDLTFVCDAGTPIAPIGEMIFVDDGIHIYHGVVVSKTESGNNLTVRCKSMQWLLDYRYVPEFIYHAATINTILGSGVPTTSTPTSDTIGAMFWINSLIANGKWIAHNATVVKLMGGGSKSIIGNASLYASSSYPNAGTTDGCDGVKSLSSVTAIPTAANTFYRTVDDLYVRFGDGSYHPNAFLVAAANAFDTKIRRGTISIGAYTATSDFSLAGQASASLDSLFEDCGLEVQFLPSVDGYVYLNLAETIGRGSETNPVKTYTDDKNCIILLKSTNDPNYQAAIGYDSSNDNSVMRVVTEWDWSARGAQLFKVYDTSGADKDDVETQLESIMANNDDSFEVRTNEVDYFLRIGDYVRLIGHALGDFVLRIQQIDIQNGLMTLTCGKKIFTAAKTFGQFLKRTEISTKQPLQTTILTDGAGTFTVLTANLVGLRVFYEESISITEDDTEADTGTFVDIQIDGKVVPPGRIKLSSGGAISLDITDYCLTGGTAVTGGYSHTVLRNLYLGTGWESTESFIKQYKARAFIAP
jgi:hypothetical protein